MAAMTAVIETWPIAGEFRIARGSKREAVVVVVTLRDGRHTGRGECTPYPRYGESPESVLAEITALAPAIAGGLTRPQLQDALRAGAARNAIDCAMWDLEAKQAGVPVWQLAVLTAPRPVTTAYTLSLDTPDAMAAKAAASAQYPLLKLKLAGDGDAGRLNAIRAARPDARLIVDANEAWPPELLPQLFAMAEAAGVELIEQPLAQGKDEALSRILRLIRVCADESAHEAQDVAGLSDHYDVVNIKLDKTGGLTEALAMSAAARTAGLQVMVGCMIATSLAMAPAALVAQTADWVDLDGPLLLARDRQPGLIYDGALLLPPTPELWG